MAFFERCRSTADFAGALGLRHLDLALAATLAILCALIALRTLIIFLFMQLFQ